MLRGEKIRPKISRMYTNTFFQHDELHYETREARWFSQDEEIAACQDNILFKSAGYLWMGERVYPQQIVCLVESVEEEAGAQYKNDLWTKPAALTLLKWEWEHCTFK
jgi:hypothetical protein